MSHTGAAPGTGRARPASIRTDARWQSHDLTPDMTPWVGEMFSYLDLRNKGITRWDAQWGYRVKHERIGSHRVVVAVVLNTIVGTLLGFAADAIANSRSVGLTVGLLALFGLAITWLLIIDLATAEEN